MPFDISPITKPFGNKMLAALPEKDLTRIKTKLEPFDLNFGETINERGDRLENVYFPESGLVSLLATLGKESVLELGLVGTDGMVGLSVFFGVPISPGRSIVQGEGVAQKMKASDLVNECRLCPPLSELLLRYTRSVIVQISQSAICNRFHKIEERLARWLLMTADYMVSSEFRSTHEVLSHVLGVRRESVSIAAHLFQDQGIIRYSRGKITILDRQALERAACPCYLILKEGK